MTEMEGNKKEILSEREILNNEVNSLKFLKDLRLLADAVSFFEGTQLNQVMSLFESVEVKCRDCKIDISDLNISEASSDFSKAQAFFVEVSNRAKKRILEIRNEVSS